MPNLNRATSKVGPHLPPSPTDSARSIRRLAAHKPVEKVVLPASSLAQPDRPRHQPQSEGVRDTDTLELVRRHQEPHLTRGFEDLLLARALSNRNTTDRTSKAYETEQEGSQTVQVITPGPFARPCIADPDPAQVHPPRGRLGSFREDSSGKQSQQLNPVTALRNPSIIYIVETTLRG